MKTKTVKRRAAAPRRPPAKLWQLRLYVMDQTLRSRLKAQFNDDAIIELTALISFQNLSSKFNAALGVAPRDRAASADNFSGSHRRGGSEPSLLTRGRRTRPTRGQGNEGPRPERWRR